HVRRHIELTAALAEMLKQNRIRVMESRDSNETD
ncbi:hypothetical protein SAMN06265220_1191, partial [Flavobacterium nitrogenifigens]